MTASATGSTPVIDPMRKLIDESNALQRELTAVTAELKEVTQQRDALLPGVGRIVVELPTPTHTLGGPPRWSAEGRRVSAHVDANGRPFVRVDGQVWLCGEADAVGKALVAAAVFAQESVTAQVNHG